MYAERVEKILSKSIEEVLASSLSLELLKLYSILYLYGGQPNICAKCMKDYYNKLKISGMKKAKELDERTSKIKKGVIRNGTYYQCLHKHIFEDKLTDSDAYHLLVNGKLKEEDFESLPQEYIDEKKAKKVEPKQEVEENEEIKEEPKKEVKAKPKKKPGRKPKTA